MLQQTQVDRVIPFYRSFIKKFPSWQKLARAPLAHVITAWQGLGYNRRARFLKEIAQILVAHHRGILPRDPAILVTLPGIGKGTAGSLSAFIYDLPVPFIETNIRRVFIHEWFPKKKTVSDEAILKLAEQTMDTRHPRLWYYALMDYGAYLGKIRKENPNTRSASYTKQSPFSGSLREARGKILKLLVQKKRTEKEIADAVGTEVMRRRALAALLKEHLIVKDGRFFALPR
jgi:A/G-specific adenine glycosylase